MGRKEGEIKKQVFNSDMWMMKDKPFWGKNLDGREPFKMVQGVERSASSVRVSVSVSVKNDR